MNKNPRSSQRGVTLVECSIALAIGAIVATAAVPSLIKLLDHRHLDGAATALATDLHAARIEAITRNRTVRVSIDPAQACWVLHTGGPSDCRCTSAGTASCDAGAEALRAQALPAAEGLQLAGNVSSIAFDPVLGTSTPAGTLRLSHRRGGEIRHTVNLLGRTRSCIEGASIAGWRAC